MIAGFHACLRAGCCQDGGGDGWRALIPGVLRTAFKTPLMELRWINPLHHLMERVFATVGVRRRRGFGYAPKTWF